MSKSPIEWTEETWNPIVGCSIVSPGCIHCYAMGEAARQIRCAAGLGRETHYAGTVEIVKGKPVWTGKLRQAPDSILTAPLRRKKPTTWFVNSMGDLFHEDCPDQWIDQVFAVIGFTDDHIYQILTKRAGRQRDYMADPKTPERIDALMREMAIKNQWCKGELDEWPPKNAWLGVSTERQQEADERIPLLLNTPAAVRFISVEPLLGPLNITRCGTHYTGSGPLHLWKTGLEGNGGWRKQYGDNPPELDWVIVGGESGPNARPMHPDWARDLRDQCAAAGVAFFFKQWGEWADCEDYPSEMQEHLEMINRGDGSNVRVGKKAAGRLLDGIEHNAMPVRP